MSEYISARTTIDWARLSAALLREKRAEINELNVFPIPDSDTGSNMSTTMDAACQSVDEALENGELVLPSGPADSAAEGEALVSATALLAAGAVHGARGNSGMVLSQVLRALAGTAAYGQIDAHAIVDMLEQASNFVSQAIATPVEGTVITVLREAAAGGRKQIEAEATQRSQTPGQLARVVEATIRSADNALTQTTNQLDALAEAGVVDAGGRGFTLLLYALRDVIGGTTAGKQEVSAHVSANTTEIEVMFLFDFGDNPQALDELRATMNRHGNSIVVAPVSTTQVKVHAHSQHSGWIIERAFSLGTVTELHLEALPENNASSSERSVPTKPIIAILPAEAAASTDDVFAHAGAISVAEEGTSGDRLGAALTKTSSDEIAILANGYDTSDLLGNPQWQKNGREYTVIDTQSLVGGLAALAVYDASQDWEDNVEDMTDAVSVQRWAECGVAQFEETLTKLLAKGGELVTVVSAPEADDEAIQKIQRDISQTSPDVELHNYHVNGLEDVIQVGVE